MKHVPRTQVLSDSGDTLWHLTCPDCDWRTVERTEDRAAGQALYHLTRIR